MLIPELFRLLLSAGCQPVPPCPRHRRPGCPGGRLPAQDLMQPGEESIFFSFIFFKIKKNTINDYESSTIFKNISDVL